MAQASRGGGVACDERMGGAGMGGGGYRGQCAVAEALLWLCQHSTATGSQVQQRLSGLVLLLTRRIATCRSQVQPDAPVDIPQLRSQSAAQGAADDDDLVKATGFTQASCVDGLQNMRCGVQGRRVYCGRTLSTIATPPVPLFLAHAPNLVSLLPKPHLHPLPSPPRKTATPRLASAPCS